MDTENWIGIGVLLTTILGFIRASIVQQKKTKKIIDDESNFIKIRVAEIDLTSKELDKEIRRLETEMIRMKGQHEKEIKELKIDFVSKLNDIVRQDREDHRILFDKIDAFTREITEAATLIKAHVKHVE